VTRTSPDEWQLSARGAEVYDDILVPSIFAPWVEKVLTKARLTYGQSVLDVACGTGIIAEGAYQCVGSQGSVVGLDINPEMLEVAAARRSGSITWRKGDAQRMPFPDQQFDRVLCQLGLQYFTDPLAALLEMRRVLKDGGQVVVMVWRDIKHSPGFAHLADLIGEYIGAEMGASMRGPFAFGDDEPRLRMLLQAAQFSGVEVQVESDDVHFHSVEEFVGQQLAASPLGKSEDLAEQPWAAPLAASLMEEFDIRNSSAPVRFPIEAYLASARRSHSES
jgi:ubiquinone/menaquinone biosynthesis C-methylase UbiE